MMMALKYLLPIAFCSFLMISCSGTKVNDSWARQDYKKNIENVYIIGMVMDDMHRMIFENTLKIRLAEEGVQAFPSHYNFSQILHEKQDSFLKKMQDYGCDAVLLTRIVEQRTKATFTSKSRTPRYVSRNIQGDQDYQRFPYDSIRINSYSAGYKALPPKPSATSLVVLTVESLLYDLPTEKLIWFARMETDLERDLTAMI
jgi:hypothetical protein